MSRTRALRLGREVLLTFTAIVGALCLLLTVASLLFGMRPLMFRSGSMSPTIQTGDLSLSRSVSASSLEPGDIVSVIAANGERVTHRIVTVSGSGEQRQLTLRGDANKSIDTQVYDVRAANRVLFTVPKAGYVVDWLSKAPGAYLLALYVGLMLMLIFRRPQGGRPGEDVTESAAAPEASPAPTAEPKQEQRRRPLRAVLIGAGMLAALVGLSGWTMSTGAYFTDAASVNGTSFAAGIWARPPAPKISVGSCTTSTGSSPYKVNFTWTGSTTNPDSFILRYSNAVLHPDQTFPGTVSRNGLATVNINNESGQFWLVAVVGGVESLASNSASYQGNGNNKQCTVAAN